MKIQQFPPPQQDHAELEKVMVELDNLKKQSERLDLINRLHGRMAGVLSLSGMIEAYSIWLMPLVAHELIGYNNSQRNKRHLFCSGHGPYRRKAIERVGLPEVRQFRLSRCDADESEWRHELQSARQIVPEIRSLLMLRIIKGGAQ